jgi:hypothetical protein
MEQVVTIPESIEYVAIEIIDKKASPENCEVITGLFKGLTILESNNVKQLFILVAGPKDAVDIYSFKYYNVMTLIVLGKNTKALTYFTLSVEDQKVAIEALKSIVVKMYAENRMLGQDPDIIDISTFKNVPDDIRKAHKTSSKVQSNINTPQQNVPCTSYVRRDPEPGVIKRVKTKKPTKEALINMITKIADIKKGTLTIALPEILGDEDEDEDDDITSPHYFRT